MKTDNVNGQTPRLMVPDRRRMLPAFGDPEHALDTFEFDLNKKVPASLSHLAMTRGAE